MAQYEEATLALREFVRLNPGNAAVLPARQLLGQVLVERGDLSAAVTEFERILVDAPNNPTALRYLRALRGRVPGRPGYRFSGNAHAYRALPPPNTTN